MIPLRHKRYPGLLTYPTFNTPSHIAFMFATQDLTCFSLFKFGNNPAQRWRMQIFAITWVAYAAFYFTRKAFSVAKLGIADDPTKGGSHEVSGDGQSWRWDGGWKRFDTATGKDSK